jgi:hypothetical protein
LGCCEESTSALVTSGVLKAIVPLATLSETVISDPARKYQQPSGG